MLQQRDLCYKGCTEKEMSPGASASGIRREYRVDGTLRGFSFILAALLLGIGVVAIGVAATEPIDAAVVFLIVIPSVFGVYMMLWAVRSRLVLDGSRITVRGVFQESSADLCEIEGYCTARSRNSSYLRIVRKSGRGSFAIPNPLKSASDADLTAWLKQIPNLDEGEGDGRLNEILQNRELGATPQDRLAALAQTRQWNIALSAVAVAAAVGMYFEPKSLSLPLAVVLAAMPMIALVILYRQPQLYTLGKDKGEPRADFVCVFMAAAFGLLLPNWEITFLSTSTVALDVIPVALLLAVFLFKPMNSGSASSGDALFGIILFAALLGAGLVTSADTLADRAQPSTFRVQVIGKHVSRGRGAKYYLDLEPWGPNTGPNDIRVPQPVYGATGAGYAVCIALHPGLLHAQWYELVDCPASPWPGVAPL
jgi:hypothetical protein